MWSFINIKSVAIISGGLLIVGAYILGISHESNRRDKLEIAIQKSHTQQLQLKQKRIDLITESYNTSISDLQLDNQSMKDKINHDKDTINNLNHINGLFVQYVSHMSSSSKSTESTNAERILLSNSESVPASIVAEYIVDLHTAQKSCVTKLNSLIDYEFARQ